MRMTTATPPTAGEVFKDAQSFGQSRELATYSDLQRLYVETGESLPALRSAARLVAKEARRRRYSSELMLQAMRIAGCYRMHSGAVEPGQGSRYTQALDELLDAYFGADSRPLDRRLTPR
jgi:hypothetical protein